MPRLAINPELEICPDFDSDPYQIVRQALIQSNNISNEQAVQQLSASWSADNTAKKAIWAQQEDNDRREKEEADRLAQEAENDRIRRAEEEAEAERLAIEKKRPKFNDIDPNSSIGDSILPRPAQFAINRLIAFKYIDLWYFTLEGCKDAADNARTISEDAFGLVRTDDILSLRPAAASKSSRNVVKDRDLSWSQFSLAKNNLLRYLPQAGWPEHHIEVLTAFFVGLEIHDYRLRPNGEQALLRYQDRVRHEWHDVLDPTSGVTGPAFNIAHINSTLLRSFLDEVWDEERAEGLRVVRPQPSYLPHHVADHLHS